MCPSSMFNENQALLSILFFFYCPSSKISIPVYGNKQPNPRVLGDGSVSLKKGPLMV